METAGAVRIYKYLAAVAARLTTLDGPDSHLRARPQAQFVENVRHMGFGGALGDDQRVGNLSVAFALGNEQHHGALAFGQHRVGVSATREEFQGTPNITQ